MTLNQHNLKLEYRLYDNSRTTLGEIKNYRDIHNIHKIISLREGTGYFLCFSVLQCFQKAVTLV